MLPVFFFPQCGNSLQSKRTNSVIYNIYNIIWGKIYLNLFLKVLLSVSPQQHFHWTLYVTLSFQNWTKLIDSEKFSLNAPGIYWSRPPRWWTRQSLRACDSRQCLTTTVRFDPADCLSSLFQGRVFRAKLPLLNYRWVWSRTLIWLSSSRAVMCACHS